MEVRICGQPLMRKRPLQPVQWDHRRIAVERQWNQAEFCHCKSGADSGPVGLNVN